MIWLIVTGMLALTVLAWLTYTIYNEHNVTQKSRDRVYRKQYIADYFKLDNYEHPFDLQRMVEQALATVHKPAASLFEYIINDKKLKIVLYSAVDSDRLVESDEINLDYINFNVNSPEYPQGLQAVGQLYKDYPELDITIREHMIKHISADAKELVKKYTEKYPAEYIAPERSGIV